MAQASDGVAYDVPFFDNHRKYFEHGLPAWRRFVKEDLQAQSLLDIGCGEGDWLEGLGIPVLGVDHGVAPHKLRIPPECYADRDLTVTSARAVQYDVVMSLETMEHLDAKYEAQFLNLLTTPAPRLIVLGVASGRGEYRADEVHHTSRDGCVVPGGKLWKPQWGRHHVNCQPVEVVIQKMHLRGWEVDEALTAKFKSLRTEDGRRYAFADFYRRNTHVYRRW